MAKLERLEAVINMANAAFDGSEGPETARLLRELADKVEASFEQHGGPHGIPAVLHDINGNRCGTVSVGWGD